MLSLVIKILCSIHAFFFIIIITIIQEIQLIFFESQ